MGTQFKNMSSEKVEQNMSSIPKSSSKVKKRKRGNEELKILRPRDNSIIKGLLRDIVDPNVFAAKVSKDKKNEYANLLVAAVQQDERLSTVSHLFNVKKAPLLLKPTKSTTRGGVGIKSVNKNAGRKSKASLDQ